jgi:peptidoglycan hydrolase-like protein with peptidoglycan-binding domain
MKVSSYNKLGQRASHGCVRLTVADAKWIYDNVPAGVVVSIVEDLPADPELKDALMQEKPPLNTKSMTPIATPTLTPEPVYRSDEKPDLKGGVLKKGSKNENVFWLQCRLKELGYYKTKCTGKMLDRTVQAVKEFQKDHGYMQSGSVDQRLIDALFEADKVTPAPVPTPAPQ